MSIVIYLYLCAYVTAARIEQVYLGFFHLPFVSIKVYLIKLFYPLLYIHKFSSLFWYINYKYNFFSRTLKF